MKTAYATIKGHFKKDNARIILYCQSHILPKWKRQFDECLNPLGVKPTFYEINSYKDVEMIDPRKEPKGIEVYLLPKDRVKRNYQVEFSPKSKFDRTKLAKISNFTDSITSSEKEKVIIRDIKDLPINLMKVAAIRLEKKYEKPIVLYKNQLNAQGEIAEYKVVTTSKILKKAFGYAKKSYDFTISDLKEFTKEIQKNIESMVKETEFKSLSRTSLKNGLTCPDCGGAIYENAKHLFDEEKHLDFLYTVPSGKSSRNSKCQHYIKADGTNLLPFEIEGIRKGEINPIFTNDNMSNPYFDEDKNPLSEEDIIKVKNNRYTARYSIAVKKCNSSLWSAYEKKGYRAVNSVERMLKVFGKNSFDFAIIDEAHLFAHQSEQGLAFSYVCKLAKINLAMTGTLTGGKASDIFYMLWRMTPGTMSKLGYEYHDINKFIDHYGRKKKVIKEYIDNTKYNKSGKGKKSSYINEIPGISPLLYTNFLSGIMVSRKIEDMGIPLPKLRYFKHEVEMSEDLQRGYDKLKDDLLKFISQNKHLSIGGSYLHSLLSYPDNPIQEPIYLSGTDMLIAVPTVLDIKNVILPKEKKLLDTIRKEVNENRRMLVYSVYSGQKGVSSRIIDVIKSAGFSVAELTSSIKLEKREEWIEKQYQNGVQVIVTNPKNVETGLDIIQYPSIYFYGISYDVKCVRQAEKRSYRPNQSLECRIYYSFYKDSLQQEAVKLVGSKKKASLALEGVFSEDMLSSMGDGGDNGAKVLFNILQGKVELRESELDAFGFENEDTISDNNSISIDDTIIPHNNLIMEEKKEKSSMQMDFFTMTDEDIAKLKERVSKGKKKKNDTNVSAGQMSFLAM